MKGAAFLEIWETCSLDLLSPSCRRHTRLWIRLWGGCPSPFLTLSPGEDSVYWIFIIKLSNICGSGLEGENGFLATLLEQALFGLVHLQGWCCFSWSMDSSAVLSGNQIPRCSQELEMRRLGHFWLWHYTNYSNWEKLQVKIRERLSGLIKGLLLCCSVVLVKYF